MELSKIRTIRTTTTTTDGWRMKSCYSNGSLSSLLRWLFAVGDSIIVVAVVVVLEYGAYERLLLVELIMPKRSFRKAMILLTEW